jgi:hypothetical protein
VRLAEYVEFLRTRPGELETLTKDLMINVTGFFRDPEAWTALDKTVVAPLIETVSKKWRIYRRLWPTRHDIIDFPLLPGRTRPNQVEESAVPGSGQPPQRLVDVAQRALLERFAPASVLIERDGRVLWFHGSTGDYQEPPPGEPSRDLLAMARAGLRVKLRNAVRRAAREKRSVRFDARVRQGNTDQTVAVTVAPLAAPNGPYNLLLVSFRNDGGGPTGCVLGCGRRSRCWREDRRHHHHRARREPRGRPGVGSGSYVCAILHDIALDQGAHTDFAALIRLR